MRKHGWQLPYHPLQIVAVAVFLALGFAFYVFFAPFVGKQLFQYIAMGIYTPLIVCAFGLYVWCAASDPADLGVFRSKKYLNIPENNNQVNLSGSKREGESISSSIQDANNNTVSNGDEAKDTEPEKNASFHQKSCPIAMLVLLPCAYVCTSHEESSDQQNSEDGMFYCSLCEVEVCKYSKHCRVCDKCVDSFDHHCRWLNNCIGKRNYRKFFALMVSALLLLIFQWSTGILVLILCLLERKRFATDINSKLGSSFTLVPFVIVVAVCTLLAMIATLPLVQLFFFHILLMKKGISTYDYIIALREQEQQGVESQQSAQMSPVSSVTGLSTTSSFNNFHRAAWCTPPRLFVEDQYDVVPPDNGSVSSLGKKTVHNDQTKKKNPAPVKISPWALARLNGEEVAKAAAEARKKSKILRPIVRGDSSYPLKTGTSIGSSARHVSIKSENNLKQVSKRIRLPSDIPNAPLSTSLVARQHEARSNFRAMPGASGIIASSSPESSVSSPGHHPFRVSSSVGPEVRQLFVSDVATRKEIPLSRSTSDGYDASGGEDSDQVPTRMLSRSTNWSSLLFGSEQDPNVSKFMAPSGSTFSNHRKI